MSTGRAGWHDGMHSPAINPHILPTVARSVATAATNAADTQIGGNNACPSTIAFRRTIVSRCGGALGARGTGCHRYRHDTDLLSLRTRAASTPFHGRGIGARHHRIRSTQGSTQPRYRHVCRVLAGCLSHPAFRLLGSLRSPHWSAKARTQGNRGTHRCAVQRVSCRGIGLRWSEAPRNGSHGPPHKRHPTAGSSRTLPHGCGYEPGGRIDRRIAIVSRPPIAHHRTHYRPGHPPFRLERRRIQGV